MIQKPGFFEIAGFLIAGHVAVVSHARQRPRPHCPTIQQWQPSAQVRFFRKENSHKKHEKSQRKTTANKRI
jgi:hypothetical protein